MGTPFDHIQYLKAAKQVLGSSATTFNLFSSAAVSIFPCHVSVGFKGAINVVNLDSLIMFNGLTTGVNYVWEMRSLNSGVTAWSTMHSTQVVTVNTSERFSFVSSPTTPNNTVPFDMRLNILSGLDAASDWQFSTTNITIRVTGDSTI